jgi:hypothetical protein
VKGRKAAQVSNPRTLFKQIDVTRVVKGLTAAGMVVGRVEVDRDGKIIAIAEHCAAKETNDWD